jgi:carbon-monoxide dehydrogenase medium subunit
MKICDNYILVNSLKDTVSALHRYSGKSRIVAGGTDFLLEIQQGLHDPVDTIIDISQIPELLKLEIADNKLIIGAALPVGEITNSTIVQNHAMALAEATGLIGGPQVRNVATLGGNVAHALPAADGMIALVSLNAKVIICNNEGFYETEILNLFNGPGISNLLSDEFIVAFKLDLKGMGESSAFDRVMRPQGVALPILNTSIWLKKRHELIEDIRIVFGPSGPVPTRATSIESFIRGKPFTQEMLESAKKILRDTVRFRTSKLRASADYRYKLAEVLFEKTITAAWQRSQDINGEFNG